MSSLNSEPCDGSASGASLLRNSAVFIQNACLQHRYIRSKDLSSIVERPERLRAVNIGLSASIARLEGLFASRETGHPEPDDLADVMNKLKLEMSIAGSNPKLPVDIVQSQASADILSHPAVKFVHGDIDGDVYLENLAKWITESHSKIAEGRSEIPDGLSQGDLYRKRR